MGEEIPLPAARPRKRKVRADEESSVSDEEGGSAGQKKRRGSGKADGSKGLRQLTRRVCDKVKFKRTTTYREVANELVLEAAASGGEEEAGSEQKTMKRRVYDALNVLMAMGIIVKDKKEIRWIGLPNAGEELESLQREKAQREERIAEKREIIKNLEARRKLYRNLAARNFHAEQAAQQPGALADNGSTAYAERIGVPFLIIHTKAGTDIACEMTNDRTQYTFNFSRPFELQQEIQIIKDMGLPDSTFEDEELFALAASPAAPPMVVPKIETTESSVSRIHDTRSGHR